MLSFGMLWARAERIALRSRALPFGSPPPVLAAIVISRESLLKSAPRFVSIAPLKRLTLDHLVCPAMRWEFFYECEPESLERIVTEEANLRGELNCAGVD